ncbi:GntR family transcriptional regulator [Rathayibacter sp. KR2-224]|uniref:GntR family transcriptional regulator n=1 Tax=Rathayibacter sp. KR2-224 TaxID=3400913 RepID=UPI003C11F59E
MQLEIDPVSEVPLYQQLRDRIVEGIAAGKLEPGAPLASVRQLAVQFGINPATVAKGYDLLRGEGLLTTHRSAGSVVAPDALHGWNEATENAWRSRMRTLVAEAIAHGATAGRITELVDDAIAGFQSQNPRLGGLS